MAFDAAYGAPYGAPYQSFPAVDTSVAQPAVIGTPVVGVPYGAPVIGGPHLVGAPDVNGSFVSQGFAGPPRVVGEQGVVGVEHVRLRVPARQQVRTVFVPGPVMNQVVQAPPREVVRKVVVQGPEQIQKVQVQAPGREVVRRVAVQGPERVVTRKVQVQGQPREVIRREQVQGPPREVIKRVEVPGPAREVIRRVEVPGPPREQIQTVQIPVPGPPREVVRKVAVPRDIVRQVVKHVDVDQWVDQPVPVQGPGAVRLHFVVDQPPVTVPVPHPVFRTQLVPTVVLVPQTQTGVAHVPQAVPQPPRVVPGPIVPEHVAGQFGVPVGHPGVAPAPFTVGGYPTQPHQFVGEQQVLQTSLGGFGQDTIMQSGQAVGAPTFGAPQF